MHELCSHCQQWRRRRGTTAADHRGGYFLLLLPSAGRPTDRDQWLNPSPPIPSRALIRLHTTHTFLCESGEPHLLLRVRRQSCMSSPRNVIATICMLRKAMPRLDKFSTLSRILSEKQSKLCQRLNIARTSCLCHQIAESKTI